MQNATLPSKLLIKNNHLHSYSPHHFPLRLNIYYIYIYIILNMLKKVYVNFVILTVFLSLISVCKSVYRSEGVWNSGPLVKREERKSIVSTEYGEISAVRISDNNGSYLLHFFTLEPNALFLPVILHADMVFYVHTGSGRLSWSDEDDTKQTELRRGDIYKLQQGSVFFIQSNLETETERQKLRIHAIFVNSDDLREPVTGPYSSIREMVTGFDRNVLQAAFKVPEEVIDELLSGTKQPAFIHGVPITKKRGRDMEAQFISSVLDSRSYNIFESNKKKKKMENVKMFNIFREDKDFENCNGWSTAVTRKKLHALHGTNIGAFMVNLTTGSMMGPHWNPMATEIAMVLQGRGIVRVVCSDVSKDVSCRNTRLLVEEGDVFVVPRFHPMAQMAFNNDTFVFIGFSTSTKKNHPQFLAGQASVLRTLDRDVLAMAFNVTNTTLDQFLAPQRDSVILGCTSCAEEELRVMQEDVDRKREEARKREEEAAKEREQEKKREEDEARKREEAKARKQEEERRKREEEEEEEERKEEEEAEARRKEEEEAEARRKEEEQAAKRKEEEEAEARRKEEEQAAKRKEEEEEEARRKEEEQAAKRKEKEEEQAAKRKEDEEEEARRKEEEEAEARRQEEAEAARQEEERRKQEEAASRREEEERQKREEEASSKKQEEERRRQEEQEGRGHEEEQQGGGQSEEEQAAEQERRMEEEARKEAEEEAARQREGGGGGSEEEAGDTPQLFEVEDMGIDIIRLLGLE